MAFNKKVKFLFTFVVGSIIWFMWYAFPIAEGILEDMKAGRRTALFISASDSANQIAPNVLDTNGLKPSCNMEILKSTEKNINQLTRNHVRLFLSTFNSCCAVNTEFSEWSNQLLFKVLAQYPDYTIDILELEGHHLSYDYIIQQLLKPITQENFQGVRASVKNFTGDNPTKQKLLNILDQQILNQVRSTALN